MKNREKKLYVKEGESEYFYYQKRIEIILKKCSKRIENDLFMLDFILNTFTGRLFARDNSYDLSISMSSHLKCCKVNLRDIYLHYKSYQDEYKENPEIAFRKMFKDDMLNALIGVRKDIDKKIKEYETEIEDILGGM